MTIKALTLTIPSPQFFPSGKAVKDSLHSIFKKCEKGWSYLGKAVRITQHSLNISPIREELAAVKAVQSFKFISSIGIPFTLVSIATTAHSIINSVKERNVEAGILGGFSIVAASADLIDSLGTVVNTAMAVTGQLAIEFFSVASLPVGFIAAGIGTITRSYQLIKTSIVFAKFRSGEIDTKLSRHDLYAHAPREIVDRLFDSLEKKEPLVQELVDIISASLKKKIIVDCGNLVANLVTITALVLFASGVAAPVGLALLITSVAIKLVVSGYSDIGCT